MSGNYIPNAYATPTALTQYTNKHWLGSGVGYDLAGNQTALQSRTFVFDAENRLIASTQPNTGSISDVYDGEGHRVQKTVGPTVTSYVYDAAGQLAAEYNSNSPASGTQYLIGDTLGSTRLVLDGSGNPKEYIDYLPFGEELPSSIGGRGALYSAGLYPSNPDIESLKFTGKERDSETGLDYFGARYFSGAQGRFTSPDEFKGGGLFDPFTGLSAETIGPLPYADITDPQTLNKYAYVRNNPLRYVDPNGHEILCYSCGPSGQDLSPVDVPSIPISSKEVQVWTGVLELASAGATFGASLDLAAAGKALQTGLSAIASAGLGVSGSTRIIANAGQDNAESTEKAGTAISAVTTPAGFVTTLATGSTTLGATASDAKGTATAILKPSEATKDAGGTLLTVGNLIQDIENLVNPKPPAPPAPPPPPKCDASGACH